ncbi:hypothetical protein [Streptomyces sp. URMC 129]|uniref:hypothetical protein n=1 Tax=Streptomyces sp. URMC 129 TaxID=3423407 RepID=UPI003F1BCED5
MTADRRAVVGWLWIDLGQLTRRGAEVRIPAADFWCARCGHTESASGGPAVTRFAATARGAHAAVCNATHHLTDHARKDAV